MHILGENITKIIKTNKNLREVVKAMLNSFESL